MMLMIDGKVRTATLTADNRIALDDGTVLSPADVAEQGVTFMDIDDTLDRLDAAGYDIQWYATPAVMAALQAKADETGQTIDQVANDALRCAFAKWEQEKAERQVVPA